MWKFRGQTRPDFAETPGPGQESVWDYPRPPELRLDRRQVRITFDEQVIAASSHAYRVLETASPPGFYLPPQDVKRELLRIATGHSMCEWKGTATYWLLASQPNLGPVGWSYPHPKPAFEPIRDYISFYPSVLSCFVADERVRPQPGQYYGGWITSEIVGPFKGEPGTGHW